MSKREQPSSHELERRRKIKEGLEQLGGVVHGGYQVSSGMQPQTRLNAVRVAR